MTYLSSQYQPQVTHRLQLRCAKQQLILSNAAHRSRNRDEPNIFLPPVPSFDLIAWMPRVDRLAVHVACIAVLNIDRVAAFAFDALLCLVVMECTQGLQLTMPKQIVVSFVRNDVIRNRSNSNDTLGSAHNTERVVL